MNSFSTKYTNTTVSFNTFWLNASHDISLIWWNRLRWVRLVDSTFSSPKDIWYRCHRHPRVQTLTCCMFVCLQKGWSADCCYWEFTEGFVKCPTNVFLIRVSKLLVYCMNVLLDQNTNGLWFLIILLFRDKLRTSINISNY